MNQIEILKHNIRLKFNVFKNFDDEKRKFTFFSLLNDEEIQKEFFVNNNDFDKSNVFNDERDFFGSSEEVEDKMLPNAEDTVDFEELNFENSEKILSEVNPDGSILSKSSNSDQSKNIRENDLNYEKLDKAEIAKDYNGIEEEFYADPEELKIDFNQYSNEKVSGGLSTGLLDENAVEEKLMDLGRRASFEKMRKRLKNVSRQYLPSCGLLFSTALVEVIVESWLGIDLDRDIESFGQNIYEIPGEEPRIVCF
jgi:hypothetical protein